MLVSTVPVTEFPSVKSIVCAPPPIEPIALVVRPTSFKLTPVIVPVKLAAEPAKLVAVNKPA